MNIDIRDTLTLSDNNKYVVASKAYGNGKNYYYLVDINDHLNCKFVEAKDDSLIEIEDAEAIKNILPFFSKSVFAALKELSE